MTFRALHVIPAASIATLLVLSEYVSAYSCEAPSCTSSGHMNTKFKFCSNDSEGQGRSDTVLHVRVTGTSISGPDDCDSGHAENAHSLEVEVLDVLVADTVTVIKGDSLLVANGERYRSEDCWRGAYPKLIFQEGSRYLLFANAAANSETFCGERVDLTMGSCSTMRPIANPSATNLCQVSSECADKDAKLSLESCLKGLELKLGAKEM